MAKGKLDRKVEVGEEKDDSIEKSKKTSAKADKEPFCVCTALVNHHCTFETGSGKRTHYNFKKGDKVAVMDEAHYLKLAHPYNQYITPDKGVPQEDGSLLELKKAADVVNPKVTGE